MKALKSEVVDTIILTLEERLKQTGKHLLKTNTIFDMCKGHINLEDREYVREELLEIGMRQVIQSRLYAHGYFSVQCGYFVNIAECENLWYLNLMLNEKDNTIKVKVAARNRIKELKGFEGQMTLVPDENSELSLIETKTKEEVEADLEADAV